MDLQVLEAGFQEFYQKSTSFQKNSLKKIKQCCNQQWVFYTTRNNKHISYLLVWTLSWQTGQPLLCCVDRFQHDEWNVVFWLTGIGMFCKNMVFASILPFWAKTGTKGLKTHKKHSRSCSSYHSAICLQSSNNGQRCASSFVLDFFIWAHYG